jgi:VWFA-related protein
MATARSVKSMWLLFPALLFSHPSHPQQASQKLSTIRIEVGLVQTDVMVFDKEGHFIPDLAMEQFELRIDGKVQPIASFEMISAGSPHDEEIWKFTEKKPVSEVELPAAKSKNPGRTLLFFVDDLHLSADSVMRCRNALSNLVRISVGTNDRVGIFAASGQIGSEQTLTSDKAGLLSLLAKFNFVSAGVEDLEYPPMTETQALMIEQNDPDVIGYFVQAMASRNRTYGGSEDPVARTKRRAAGLAETSAGIGQRVISRLRLLLRSAEDLPGRKLVFFLSDGFVLQTRRSDIISRIGDLTTAAARAGIMIYTLDARGLEVGMGMPEAKRFAAPDTGANLLHSGYNETLSKQDALNALASDTGGRFLKNTNALDTALITTLTEISRYYLLGWYIDPEKLKPGKFNTIKATIKGRSDFTVRVRQGSLDLSKLVQDKK